MPDLPADESWALLAAARTLVLATIDPAGAPRPVPVCHVVLDRAVFFAVDDVKPKRRSRLARLSDIDRDTRVALLAAHYEEDWSALWWVRATGAAAALPAGDPAGDAALRQLAAKYPPYAAAVPPGPVVRVRVTRIIGWSATEREAAHG